MAGGGGAHIAEQRRSRRGADRQSDRESHLTTLFTLSIASITTPFDKFAVVEQIHRIYSYLASTQHINNRLSFRTKPN